MNQPLEYLLLFVASMAAGYIVTKLIQRLQPLPLEGARIRLRMAGGVGRTRLLAKRPGELVLGAILPAPDQLPEVGESVILEATTAKGPLYFRSRVRSIDPEPFMLVIEEPARTHLLERRTEKRRKASNVTATVEGLTARLIDFSPGGAKVQVAGAPHPGDRIHITLNGEEKVGWVLDVRKSNDDSSTLRLCFDRN